MKTRMGVVWMLVSATLIWCSTAQAALQDLIFPKPCGNVNTTYAAKPGETIMPTQIEVGGTTKNIFWGVSPAAGCAATPPTSMTTFSCVGLTITSPDPNTAVSPAMGKTTVTGTASSTLGAQGQLTVTVTEEGSDTNTCNGTYLFHTTQDGGGWGDPHMTTVDGVHYDFQGAGEYTALREDKFEVQTRQTAVPSATVPVSNEYTGLRSCVAIYTAVAARVGSNRVTLEPNLNGKPDPSGLQLRVNGELATLTAAGIPLMSGGGSGGPSTTAGAAGTLEGRIAKAGTGDGIEITDARGTQLVITPAFWDSQQLWYLNVNVYQTGATQGILGKIAEGSWLPALPDGTSVGPKGESADERYQQLYAKFGDAWRVKDDTSLFDYAPGTTTATFTRAEWPRNDPQSCGIEGQTSVPAATPEVAAQACSGVTNAVQKADCIFDVTVTGHTGFGKNYEAMQAIRPHGTGWQPPLTQGSEPPPGTSTLFPWWWILILLLLLILIVWFLRRRKAGP